MSKTFNKDIQYIFNPQITLPTSSGLTITGNSNTIGNIFTTGGNVGIGTDSPRGSLELFSTAQTTARLILSGQEFYQSGNSSTHGIALLAGVNRSNNHQLWIGATRNLTQNSTNSVIRITGNLNTIDSIATDGDTVKRLILGNNGGVSLNGDVGIGTNSPAHKLDVVGTIDATTYTGSNIMISGSIGSLGSIDAGSQFLGQANDTISAPSFSWTGDTNTGIYRPLTDQLGFVTNGVERMRVSSAGNIGIGTTAPSTALDVNGSIKHLGGYAVFGLSTIGYANGTSTLQFGNTQFSSRITNNTSSFTFQDAGIFMIHVKLNSDSTITGVIQLLLQFFNGTSWVTYQTSEDSRAYTGATEFITHYMVEASANQQWRLSFNNASGSTWNFATQTGIDYWSRLMIYKVA